MTELSEHERLQRLLLYVRTHGPVSRAQLQQALPECYAPYEGDQADTAAAKRHEDAVRRRMQRDRSKLQALGFALAAGDDDLYALDEAATFATGTPRTFSKEEAAVVRQVASAHLLDPDALGKDTLRRALAKCCEELDVPDALPLVGQEAPLFTEPRGLGKALKAIRLRKRLQFDYCDAGGKASSREVEPFGTFVHNHRCYIVARDPQAGSGREDRTFRLDRMSRLKVEAREGDAPDFEKRAFDAEKWHRLPFQIGNCAITAVVFFDENLSWKAPALTMHRGTLTQQGGDLLWSVDAADLEELASWCIEVGPGVVPLEPPEARAAYQRVLLRSLEACS